MGDTPDRTLRFAWTDPGGCWSVGSVVRVTRSGFAFLAGLRVMFWMSARQGGTDTTARPVRAGAKWLVPGLVSSLESVAGFCLVAV
jgi:hypothetical protein